MRDLDPGERDALKKSGITVFTMRAIDELRISKGDRYGGKAFTPAARHEPDDSTLLLLHLDGPIGPFAPDHSKSAAHGCRLGRVEYRPVSRNGKSGSD